MAPIDVHAAGSALCWLQSQGALPDCEALFLLTHRSLLHASDLPPVWAYSGLENFLDGEIWMVVVHRSTTFFSSEWPRPPLFSSDGLLKDFSSLLGKELVGATTEDLQRREKEGEGEV
ncbi:unnamed protein product [Linum tenue]|uniref:Uncharacterized protein n=1 Tax=Linum tenue TaxID=586396 RepID=A0AAV0H7Z9_9ROSI|nr:unnamed protein product [Linum tenue]CAI0551334.1 unnamed protein product [Linum tenue]CAI0551335.1 unnamed protein product [Linum tenue]